jgi:pilus assembly protein Flp/PilA
MERGMVQHIKNRLVSSRKEKGQDLAEYALLIGLLALVLIISVTLLGTNISTMFSNLAAYLGSWDIGG